MHKGLLITTSISILLHIQVDQKKVAIRQTNYMAIFILSFHKNNIFKKMFLFNTFAIPFLHRLGMLSIRPCKYSMNNDSHPRLRT